MMIENHFLHAAAWSLLCVLPPKSAFRWTSRIGRFLPALRGELDALRVADAIEPRGTCLSRALTVAARLPDAEVVIGVDSGSLSPRVPFMAHAWVELNGAPLRTDDAREGEIVRFRVRDGK